MMSWLATFPLALGLLAAAQDVARPQEIEPDELRPGLVAAYRSLIDKDAILTRLDAKPVFSLGHSSPHPRLPPGPFEVAWTGVLFVADSGPISFDASACGEVTVELDGVTVLHGRGESETARIGPGKPLDRERGFYPLTIRYRALPGLPARLQLAWQAPSFTREPVPAWHFKHRAAALPRTVAQEQQAEMGRAAVVRFGCARCHGGAFPGVTEPPPGPALADVALRVGRPWLLAWLNDPAKVQPGARMPALFTADRKGFVERWLVAEHLLGASASKSATPDVPGDHRMGRRQFVGLGCAACHFLPDLDRAEQPDRGQTRFVGLADRLPAPELAAFLAHPHARYPDGRMPRLPLAPETARDIAAYLLLWSKPAPVRDPADKPPTLEEIDQAARRLGVRGASAAGAALLRAKRCASCHPGLGQGLPADVPLAARKADQGCLSGKTLPRFIFADETKPAIAAYQAVAAREKHPSPFAARQRRLDWLGCVRCHQRDSDRPAPLEAIGSTLGSAWLQNVAYQRTPRLTYPHQKFTRTHLLAAVREGVTGLRPGRYTYRMPAFGHDAEAIVQALAEADGELPAGPEPPPAAPADPTLATLHGPHLAGFQGYSCVSCHIWNGQGFAETDPGAVGTDLTRVAGRIRREWFDRFLEAPARSHPGTPMPSIFLKGKPALLPSVLDGNPARQKDALWAYFALGKAAPGPKPPPPLPVTAPQTGASPVVAQVPVRLPDGTTLESLCVLFSSHDLIVYDLGSGTPHSGYVGAQLLRGVQGRLRTYTAAGTPVKLGNVAESLAKLIDPSRGVAPPVFLGYDRLSDGVRLRWQATLAAGEAEVIETVRLPTDKGRRGVLREVLLSGGTVRRVAEWPAAQAAPEFTRTAPLETATPVGALERPGYRAIAYPRPKTVSGEDLVMPSAVAVHPRDGRVFIASMKLGELFVLRDPTGDGKAARFDDYARGLFQEAYSMLAEPDALYVLHRRNLTKIVDTNGDGVADRFDRVAALPHGIADTYDYGYGLVRDKTGAFVFSYAPYANRELPGSGGALRLIPGQKPREIGFGFRNPVGWCAGPDGEVFFTDNQGEWVATNKLCHLAEGRFYGFPNPAQRQHATKPPGKTTVWVPYAWAKSINGVTYDSTGGKFGPFAGQIFMAELMFGGAIIRANVEKVNGQYQGACFPFWGPGLLGPVCLAFDPKGPLYVGGITEPGWMAQPDRGALFRIDYTGQVPFEMKSLHVRPRGFRVVFTAPVDAGSARDPASYQIDHHRYEYTGAYGSPELDRTRLAIERVEVAADGLSAELFTGPLVKDRVYMIHARGVRSAQGTPLVHPTGAYTLHEIPAGTP